MEDGESTNQRLSEMGEWGIGGGREDRSEGALRQAVRQAHYMAQDRPSLDVVVGRGGGSMKKAPGEFSRGFVNSMSFVCYNIVRKSEPPPLQ